MFLKKLRVRNRTTSNELDLDKCSHKSVLKRKLYLDIVINATSATPNNNNNNCYELKIFNCIPVYKLKKHWRDEKFLHNQQVNLF